MSMSLALRSRLFACISFFGFACLATVGFAVEGTVTELLPKTTVIYVEVSDPAKIVDGVMAHPLYAKVMALDVTKKAYEQKQYKDFLAGVSLFEGQVGMPWREAIAKTAAKGIVLAVDGETKGVMLAITAEDEASQAKLLEALSNISRLDAVMKGKEKPAELSDYRGVKGYKVSGVIVGLLGKRLVVCNNEAFAKKIVDAHLDHPSDTFAKSDLLKSAEKSSSGALAFGVVDVAKVRDAGLAKELFGGHAENPAAELLFGGLLSTLKQTPYATLAVRTIGNGLEAKVEMPHDRKWAGDQREYFFGAGGIGAAPESVSPPGALFSLRAHRDISGMWLRAGDLFDEKVNEEMAKAETGISNLLAGKDFAEDILGVLGPQVEIVSALHEFESSAPVPAIKLPGFAFVFDLKDPEAAVPELRRNFQNGIGFFNIVGAMNGQPQFETESEKIGGGQIVSATCVADKRKLKDAAAVPIQYNFSPTVAFAGKRFVISSTRKLAKDILAAKPVATEKSASSSIVTNTAGTLAGKPIRAVLEANREQLIVQNMLEEGRSREEAEVAIGVLFEIVSWFDSAALALDASDDKLSLKLDVKLDPGLTK
jgi:hypothetical protein